MLDIGHRGSPNKFLENTIESFKSAILEGADGIEFDVHICKSGEVVVIHDDTIDRTTGAKGKVIDFTLPELQKLGIPSLEEVFLTLGRNIYYFVEIKSPQAALPTAIFIDSLIKQGLNADNIYIISFNHNCLCEVKKAFPHINIGASFEKLHEDSIKNTSKLSAQAIIPHYEYLNEDYVKQAHAMGLKVITWTVNKAEDIKRISEMGVDGIISDYPDLLGVNY